MRSLTQRVRPAVALPLILILAGLASVASSGCGGEGRAAKALLPSVSRALHWAGEVAPAGGHLSEVATGLGTAIDTGTSIRTQLTTIAGSDDPYGKAFVIAVCYGLTTVADQHDQDSDVLPPSVQSWETYLDEQVTALLPDALASEIDARVTQFVNAAELASINPAAARTYVNECVLRKS